MKKEIVGKLQINTKLTYSDSQSEKIQEITRSSSALQIGKRIEKNLNRGSMVTMKNGSTNQRKTLESYLTKTKIEEPKFDLSPTKSKKSYDVSRIPSIKRCSSVRRSSYLKTPKIKDELDSSRIETLFDDDKLSSIENVGKKLMEKIDEIADRYKGRFDVDPEHYTLQGLYKLRDNLFEIIELYHFTFDNSVSLNSILKSYLLSYSENFRTINKKMNKLNELLETLSVKAEFSDRYYRDDNEIIYNSIDILRKEIHMYKIIFNLKYTKELEEKYKEEMKNEKCKYNQ